MKIQVHRIQISVPCGRCTVPEWDFRLVAGFLSTSEVSAAMATAKLGELRTFAGRLKKAGGVYFLAIRDAVLRVIDLRDRMRRQRDREIEAVRRKEDVALREEEDRRYALAAVDLEDSDIVPSEVFEVPTDAVEAARWLWGVA